VQRRLTGSLFSRIKEFDPLASTCYARRKCRKDISRKHQGIQEKIFAAACSQVVKVVRYEGYVQQDVHKLTARVSEVGGVVGRHMHRDLRLDLETQWDPR
jgi:hypothetical protein